MRPKPKRLRPVRTHRNATLAELAPEQKAVAEQVLRGGVPAVRQALEEQNAKLRAESQPEVPPAGVIALAEELLPRLRVAEWLDRAEGALNDLDELDLRDLRSVVVASDDPAVARDESTRDLAARLKDGLANRQDKEHQDWLADIDAALGVGRVVRALRLSSRPPKAGVRFPAELAARLTQATSPPSPRTRPATAGWRCSRRWPTPRCMLPSCRRRPSAPTDELRATVKRLAGLVPEIATLFGIEPPAPGSRAPRPPRRPPARKPDKAKVVPPPPAALVAEAAEAAEEAAAAVDTSASVVVDVEAAATAPEIVEIPVDVEAAPEPAAEIVEARVDVEAPRRRAPAAARRGPGREIETSRGRRDTADSGRGAASTETARPRRRASTRGPRPRRRRRPEQSRDA